MKLLHTIAQGLRTILTSVRSAAEPEVRNGQKEFHFFRYSRPLDFKNPTYFDPTGADEETLTPAQVKACRERGYDLDEMEIMKYNTAPHGGATVYFHWFPEEKRAELSFALCQPDRAFNKKEGRDECLQRFTRGEVLELAGVDTRISLLANLYIALVDKFSKTKSTKTLLISEAARLTLIPQSCPETRLITLKHWLELCLAQKMEQDEDMIPVDLGEFKVH